MKSIGKIRFVEEQPPTTWSLAPRVRILLERESRGRSSTLGSGNRAPPWRILKAAHTEIQRIQQSSCRVVQRNGPTEKPLTEHHSQAPRGKVLAAITSTRLFDCRWWCHPLLLACEIRYPVTRPVWCGPDHSFDLSPVPFHGEAPRKARTRAALSSAWKGMKESAAPW
jgi:hypothetical protein